MEENYIQYFVSAIGAILVFFAVKYGIDSNNTEEDGTQKHSSITIYGASFLASILSFVAFIFLYNWYIQKKSSRKMLREEYNS